MKSPYLPARLVQASDRWYICFYQTNPVTGKRERFRETFDINRVKSIRRRRQMANKRIDEINNQLPLGYPFNEFIGSDQLFMDALKDAIAIKCRMSNRIQSHHAFRGMETIMTAFFDHYKLSDITLDQFDQTMAKKFLKWAILIRQVSNVTRNNYLTRMKSLLNEIFDDTSQNPFTGLKSLAPQTKKRRSLDDDEAGKIYTAASEYDSNLTLAILLLFHCFIRPTEQRRLRIGHINLRQKLIRITTEVAKNKKEQSVIIPEPLVDVLHGFGLHNYRKSDYLFGRSGEPGSTPIGKRRMASYHDHVVDELEKKGEISDTGGVTLYSWKDTGAIALLNEGYDVRKIQRQLRHSSLDMTQRYLDSLSFSSYEISRGSSLLKKTHLQFHT